MRLVFLLLFSGFFLNNQVPLVSNYGDFILGVEKSEPTALRMSTDEVRYGTTLSSEVYQEVLPIDETHVLLVKEVFETIPSTRGDARGESYVCLCQKTDLVNILQRWKDGQYGVKDYAKFDCKYRSFTDRSEMFKGDSFWQSIDFKGRLIKNLQDVESISLSEKVNLSVYKNRNNPLKKILKISYELPSEHIVKEVEAESFLTSVKGASGAELYETSAALGWKSLFPEWKDYRQLNTGFWGVPKQKKSVINQRFTKSFSIECDEQTIASVKGQTTFLVKTDLSQTKTLGKLVLKKNDNFVNGDVYLDYGEYIHCTINGLSDDHQRVLVGFDADIPIQSLTAHDAMTGTALGTAKKTPFELELPVSTKEISLVVDYAKLKKARVDFLVKK